MVLSLVSEIGFYPDNQFAELKGFFEVIVGPDVKSLLDVVDSAFCSLKLTFIWRFNGFKPKNESDIDTSRFGTSR